MSGNVYTPAFAITSELNKTEVPNTRVCVFSLRQKEMGLNVLTVTETIKLQEGEKVQPEPGDLDPRWPRLFLHFISSLLTQLGHLTEEPCAWS